jgi:hypothetical protein
MAAAPHPDSLAHPVLPHPSRLGLIVWFAAQWVVIPLEFLARAAWLFVIILGMHNEDPLPLRDAFARFLSPGKLLLRMSRDPARHEAYLDRKFARLAEEIDQRKFSWRTRICHHVTPEVHPDGYLYCVGLRPRDYRGIPLSTLKRLASAHHLTLEASSNLKNGVALRPVRMKDSW